MPDLTDLIARVESAPLQERLRAKRFHSYGRMPDDEPNYALINPDGPEAADIITTQKAEIAALRKAVEKIRAIASQPTYPGNNLRDIDLIARAALGDPHG